MSARKLTLNVTQSGINGLNAGNLKRDNIPWAGEVNTNQNVFSYQSRIYNYTCMSSPLQIPMWSTNACIGLHLLIIHDIGFCII